MMVLITSAGTLNSSSLCKSPYLFAQSCYSAAVSHDIAAQSHDTATQSHDIATQSYDIAALSVSYAHKYCNQYFTLNKAFVKYSL